MTYRITIRYSIVIETADGPPKEKKMSLLEQWKEQADIPTYNPDFGGWYDSETGFTFSDWKKAQWSESATAESKPEPKRSQSRAHWNRDKVTLSAIVLNVPYAKKDIAKAAGAKWDGKKKTWFWPAGAGDLPASLAKFAA